MKTKSFYEAPESELLLVKFEEAFLQTSPQITTGGSRTVYEFDDLDSDSD